MSGDQFDRITREISSIIGPGTGPGLFAKWLKLASIPIVVLFRRSRTSDSGWPTSAAGTPAELVTLQRMQFVRTRELGDVPNVRIRPRQFLASLDPGSRAEFLSIMAVAQRERFLGMRTSREFFSLLTPDQRADLVVNYQPMFRGSDSARGYRMRPAAAQPPMPPPSIAYGPRPPSLVKQIGTTPKPRVTAARVNACLLSGLTWNTCNYTYQATVKTDRDGAPCTYGPYPCGSGIPPNPPGRSFETPFCPDPIADQYGCGALANQVANVTDCPRQPGRKGVPLEHICNATNNVNCSYPDVSKARFTSVVTNCSYPNTKCITDSYRDPGTGDTIHVPVKTDVDGCSPCIQQSEPGACGGVDCPCPGLYISTSALSSPAAGAAPMNPDNYLNALFVPFISVPKAVRVSCGLEKGMFVVASASYDAQSNPSEDPSDWVAGILGDVGGHELGEVSYAMRDRLGVSENSNVKVTFRIYPQVKVTGWPITIGALDALKAKYLGVCCPGDINNQCHSAEQRGTCVTDATDPDAGSCRCRDGWLPDVKGDCTWQCPGSDGSHWVGLSTDSGYEECGGHGKCAYMAPDQNGDTIGVCECDDGWWGGLLSPSCPYRDCVKLDDWDNPDVPPCYGHGQCHHGVNPHNLGTCTCDEGWTNGPDGIGYCSERACAKDCSAHGACTHDADGNPSCLCDIAHGWYGVDCSQRGCVTEDGRICSGNGVCQLDANGNPCCACPDEWGGDCQVGPKACGTRRCAGCPPGVADCYDDFNWYEAFAACAFGNHCQHVWRCRCKDNALQPPGCTTRRCCSGFWGECNSGMHIQGIGGGGTCMANGVCQCHDSYDPNQCCGYPLPGAGAPQGFGRPCFGTSAKTISLSCSGQSGVCSYCTAGSTSGSWTLRPDGGGKYHDDNGNLYQLNESACTVALTSFGPGTLGGQCGKTPDPVFWLTIQGNAGSGVSALLCPTDCAVCHDTIPCTLTVH